MTIYQDLTRALQIVLLHFLRGYTRWVAFHIDEEKLAFKADSLAVDFGTRLPSWKRQDRKQAGLPNAVTLAVRSAATPPGKCTVVLMATEAAEGAHPASPWARQRWNANPVELGPYELVYERRDRGDSGWTWRLKAEVINGVSRYVHSLTKTGDADLIRRETELWLKVYSMWRGVRHQLRKLLRSQQRLWSQLHPSSWPGLKEEQLPHIGSWRKPGAKASAAREPLNPQIMGKTS